MTPGEHESDRPRARRPGPELAGAVAAFAGLCVLAVAAVRFVFYAFCDENCAGDATWSFWPALGAAAPSAIAGVALLTCTSVLWRSGRGEPISWRGALGSALVATVAFLLAAALLVGLLAL